MTIGLILQAALVAAGLALAGFCLLLSRRLRKLNDLETGLGGAIAVMAAEIARLEAALGRISGVQRFGAFVKLDETGADGLLPIREIGREYFHFDRDRQVLEGADTGLTIGIGQRVTVRLAEAIPTTGGLTLELVEIEGRGIPAGSRVARGKGPRRRDVTSASAGRTSAM